MTDKAYIVANEQQEREVLEKFETKGYVWTGEGEKPTEFVTSHIEHLVEFPYALLDDGELSWCYMSQLDNDKIVYDGRKEEQMSDKYVVSQEFMNELKEWKENNHLQPHVSFDGQHVSWQDLESIPMDIKKWWHEININDIEINNRLIAIIRWVNGEDVFEVEKFKKWVVRSKDSSEADRHLYVRLDISYKVKDTTTLWGISNATRFDTKEEAESWANTHQEVVEVED